MNVADLRKYRVGPFAIFDFSMSFLAAALVAPLVKNYVSRERLLWGVIPLGVATHELFRLRTPLNKMVLGPDTNILAQLVVGLMLMKTLAQNDRV
jgi:hypothetical protein